MCLHIKLNFNRRDFEEIYFENKQGSLFFSPQTKTKTIATLLLGTLMLATFSNSYSTSSNWGFFYFNVLLFIFSLINLANSVYRIFTWKNQVMKYLNDTSKFEKFEIKLTENYLSVLEDESETKIKLAEFKKIELKENCIILEGSNNFLFPKKSMSDSDFVLFSNFIREKLI